MGRSRRDPGRLQKTGTGAFAALLEPAFRRTAGNRSRAWGGIFLRIAGKAFLTAKFGLSYPQLSTGRFAALITVENSKLEGGVSGGIPEQENGQEVLLL